MKKVSLLSIVAIAMVGCSNEVLIDDIKNDGQEVGIGFSTFTDVATKAENSGATVTSGLEGYHESFKVWGSKYIGTTPTVVFTAQEVNYESSDWKYTPIRFWDKSATSYDFYAAAPADLSWGWDNDNKKLSLSNFAVDGLNIAKTTEANATIDNKAKFNAKDIMISSDVTGYNAYTNDAVNLTFNHILSRLNIGVKKGDNLSAFVVKLESVKVYNMVKQASFDEKNVTEAATLSAGTVLRWTPASTPVTFTAGVGYETETEVTSDLNYVYQGLVIPQSVAVQTVALDGQAHAKVDATDPDGTPNSGDETAEIAAIDAVGASSKPYLVISYEIWTKEVAEVKYTDEAEATAAGKSVGDVKTPAVASAKVDSYTYYYNLANIFNGTATTAVDFNEGWQNTLNITINPTAIKFDADVYQWDSKTPVNVTIPDDNGL